MKKYLRGLLACLALTGTGGLPAMPPEPAAEGREFTALITLIPDQFELAETYISHLPVGDSETIVTDKRTAIDLIRILDGVEVHVDGVLLETGHGRRCMPGRMTPPMTRTNGWSYTATTRGNAVTTEAARRVWAR